MNELRRFLISLDVAGGFMLFMLWMYSMAHTYTFVILLLASMMQMYVAWQAFLKKKENRWDS